MGVFFYGQYRVRQTAAARTQPGMDVRCLVIQPATGQLLKIAAQMGDEAAIRRQATDLIDLTRTWLPTAVAAVDATPTPDDGGQRPPLLEAPAPFDLVLWPESALPLSYEQPDIQALLDDLLKQGSFSLLGGVDEQDMDGRYNSLFLARGRASDGLLHRKGHLVPFGEYLPMRPILGKIPGMANLLPSAFQPGTSREPLPLTLADGRPGPSLGKRVRVQDMSNANGSGHR
jgi:apolipoprotein N-acyltransferase